MTYYYRRRRGPNDYHHRYGLPGKPSRPKGPLPYEDEYDEENDPLIQRLRNMKWPKPSDEVRDRCLREIMKRAEEMEKRGELRRGSPADDEDAGEPGDGEGEPDGGGRS